MREVVAMPQQLVLMLQVTVCLLLPVTCGEKLSSDITSAGGGLVFKNKSITVRIGALIDLNASMGAAVKKAIETAVDEVNAGGAGGGRREGSGEFSLELHIFDAKGNAYQANSAAIELFKKEVVAVVGPQSTTGSHFIAHMGTNLRIALASYGATDPSLSRHQYPFFLRMAHNDQEQMKALGKLIAYYGWRSMVALYTDDDYGSNAITTLEDALIQHQHQCMFRKEPLSPTIDRTGISSILSRLAMMESRIFIIHAQPQVGLQVIKEAEYLGMVDVGFVWIITDLLTTSVRSMQQYDLKVAKATRGFIGVQRYIPPSPQLSQLFRRWMMQDNSSELNVYALCAYDSVWLIAKAIQNHIRQGSTFTFEHQPILNSDEGGLSELAQLKFLREGFVFRQLLLATCFNGTTGWIELDPVSRDMQTISFEFVNLVGRGIRTIGYWNNKIDSVSTLPGTSSRISSNSVHRETQHMLSGAMDLAVKLPDVVWPGGTTQVPRAWVLPQNGRPLLIGVPRKAGYKELIRQITDINNVTTFHGFCINVFESAVQYLPYAFSFQFISYGSGNDTPDYDNLILKLANQEFDAIVGDATITQKRLDLVDFTQPYIESGMQIIVQWQSKAKNNEWAFLQPFSPALWITIGVFFLLTGSVIWMLEHKVNQAFRGHPRRQIVNCLWFIFSTLFFAHREKIKTMLGRAVLIIWLFVVLIITSSYTANLTSILTVQQLTPSVLGIHSLLASNDPIGYQAGSYVWDYLINLGVKPSRLIPLNSKTMYAKALRLGPKNGGVGAVVDEQPYVQLFLATEGDKEFTTAGQEFTKSGWAFAFQKNSQLTTDISEAILKMSENGELQKIHNLWFNIKEGTQASTSVDSSQLDLRTFSGLFLVTGLASTFCVMVYMGRSLRSFHASRCVQSSMSSSWSLSRSKEFLRSFAVFLDKPSVHGGTKRSGVKELKAMTHSVDITPISSFEREDA